MIKVELECQNLLLFYIFVNLGMICMGLKTIPNAERVLVQYKFEDEDSVYIKMMTLNGYQDLKKIDSIEYCKLMK